MKGGRINKNIYMHRLKPNQILSFVIHAEDILTELPIANMKKSNKNLGTSYKK